MSSMMQKTMISVPCGESYRFSAVLAGPSRFSHINNTARSLLEQLGYIASKGKAKGGKASGSKQNKKKR